MSTMTPPSKDQAATCTECGFAEPYAWAAISREDGVCYRLEDCLQRQLDAAQEELTRLAEVERERDANAVALAATVTRADRAERERDEARACENSQNEDVCGACLVCAEVGRDHALRQRAEALARAEAAEEALVNQKAFVVEFARRVEQVWKEQEVARETAERDLDRERDARRRATMLLGEIVTQRDAWRKRAEVAETKLARLCDCDAGVPEKPHDPECAALAPAPEARKAPAVAFYPTKEQNRNWQCSGCRWAFYGPWQKVCPACGLEDYWTGSVEPHAALWPHNTEPAPSTDPGGERFCTCGRRSSECDGSRAGCHGPEKRCRIQSNDVRDPVCGRCRNRAPSTELGVER